MVISDLYPTGLHEKNLGHFSAIVALALRDNIIDENEYKLLKRLAKRLDISKSEFKLILRNPKKYPVIQPISYDERLEHLYDLTKMMFLDKNPTIDKKSIMDRIAIGLGFPVKNARVIVEAAIKFFLKEPDIDDFKAVIKKVNPMKN